MHDAILRDRNLLNPEELYVACIYHPTTTFSVTFAKQNKEMGDHHNINTGTHSLTRNDEQVVQC